MAPPSIRRQILGGSAYLTGEQVLTLSLSLVYSVLLFRYLGPRTFGGFSVALAVLAIGQLLAGTYESYLERFVPAYLAQGAAAEIKRSFRAAWVVKTTSAAAVAILLSLFGEQIGALVGVGPLGGWLTWLCWTVPANACIDMTLGLTFGLKRFGVRVLVSGTRNFLKVASVAICFAAGRTVEDFIVVLAVQTVLVALGSLGANYVLLRRLPAGRSLGGWTDVVGRVVRYSTPIAAGNFVFSLHEYSGKLILAPFFPAEIIGYFSFAMDTISRLVALVRGLSTALLPVMAEALARRDPAAVERITEGAFRYLTAVGVLMSVGTISLAPEVTRILAGKAFIPAVTLLGAMGMQLVFRLPAQPLTMGLYAYERPMMVLRLTVERYVLMLALYGALIPLVGIAGACWADVLSFFGIFFRFTSAAQRYMGVGNRLRGTYVRTVSITAVAALLAVPLWQAGTAGIVLRLLWVPMASLLAVLLAGLVRAADLRLLDERLPQLSMATGVLARLAAITARLGER
jgi:O-antigen/teichoic acid export membrane protein